MTTPSREESPAPLRVALVGAESTGKSTLAARLAAHWRAEGKAVTHVEEYLREWCDRERRVPLEHQQDAIAREQARREAAAPAGHWLVADAPPLMVAAYSELVFGDRSLYPFAIEHHRRYDVTLLMGLDLPWVADGLRDGAHAQEPTDALLRAALETARLPYSLVYGAGERRLQNVLRAIESVARNPALARCAGRFDSEKPALAPWCEDCDDPASARRLFTASSG